MNLVQLQLLEGWWILCEFFVIGVFLYIVGVFWVLFVGGKLVHFLIFLGNLIRNGAEGEWTNWHQGFMGVCEGLFCLNSK